MSTELQAQHLVVNPMTSEVVDLNTAAPEKLGEFITQIDEAIALLRDARSQASEAVLHHLDFNATGTLHVPGYKLTAPKGTEEKWDGADLRTRLLELVDAGELSIEAVDNAVQVSTTYTVHKRGINALVARGGEAREIVEGLRVEVPKSRPVRVEAK